MLCIMRLKREYKQGTFIKVKWYDRWQDEYEKPNNFRIAEGCVESNTCMNEVIVYNGHENNWYAVPTENIIQEF